MERAHRLAPVSRGKEEFSLENLPRTEDDDIRLACKRAVLKSVVEHDRPCAARDRRTGAPDTLFIGDDKTVRETVGELAQLVPRRSCIRETRCAFLDDDRAGRRAAVAAAEDRDRSMCAQLTDDQFDDRRLAHTACGDVADRTDERIDAMRPKDPDIKEPAPDADDRTVDERERQEEQSERSHRHPI